MKSGWQLATIVFSFMALLSACGGGNGSSPNPPPVTTHGWTWVSGSTTINQAGVYGTQGTAAASNVPGARYSPVSWIDSQGKLWLFGGDGYDSASTRGELNDLWKYDPTTLEWTWVSGSSFAYQAGVYGTQGTAAPSNVPGSRGYAISWVDSQGKFWLFGGYGYDSTGNYLSYLNDLWEYDPTTLEWAWVSGSNIGDQAGSYGTQSIAASSNVPGARQTAVSWIDSQGKLWLFGGTGYDSAGNLGYLNDLWKYDPTTLEWTWVSGSSFAYQAGVYGTQGTAAPSNVPGSRGYAISWVDSQGKFWLFGGYGYDSTGNYLSYLNDLWEYDPTTLEWAWVSGSNIGDQAGSYGTQSIAASSNVPGARYMAVSWIDSNGKLWLFGGWGIDSADNGGYLNDLWEYDPNTLEWTWVSGGDTGNQAGVYGTQGTAAASNVPGAREYAVSWFDSQGKLWLFGGSGYDSASTLNLLNDLWKYDPMTLEWTWVSGSNTGHQKGTYGTKGTVASTNVPGSRNMAVSWIDSSGKLWLFGGWALDSANNGGSINDLWKYTK